MSTSGFLDRDELEAIGFRSVGSNVSVDASARFYGAERIDIGSNTRIDAFAVISAGAGGIRLGSYVHIAAFAFVAGRAAIVLDDFVGLACRVSVYSSNDDYGGAVMTGPTIPDELRHVDSRPVRLGRHVVAGAGSVILPGVTMGDGSACGALTLVKRDVEPFTIVAGHDQRVVAVRKRDLLERERRLRD